MRGFVLAVAALFCLGVFLLLPVGSAGAGPWETLPSPGFNCGTADFVDSEKGWVGGDNWTALPSTMQWAGFISRSSTGGRNWQSSGYWEFLFVNDLDFVDGSRGWATLDDGTILSSATGGSTWTVQAEGSSGYADNNWTYTSISMANAMHGSAVGSWVGFIGISYPRIVYTVDGTEWKNADLPDLAGGSLQSICMVDAEVGWAVGSAGPKDQTPLVLVTMDGGATWARQTNGLRSDGLGLHGVWFVDRQHGWAVGELGTIYATSDGGTLWQSQGSGVSETLLDVRFAELRTGWVVGEGGTILETTKAGYPWVAQTSPTDTRLRAVASADGFVWAAGDGGVVLRAKVPGQGWFSDIGSSPHKEAIENLAAAGVINGFPDRSFRPETAVTRQQFAKMIDLAMGLTVVEGFEPFPFTDVFRAPNNPYPDDYIAVAWQNGFVEGKGNGRFDPYSNMTRAQLLTIVVRAAEKLKPTSIVEPPRGWIGVLPATDPTHGRNIALAEHSGLLAGVDLTQFDVLAEASRGQVAQVLWNLWRG